MFCPPATIVCEAGFEEADKVSAPDFAVIVLIANGVKAEREMKSPVVTPTGDVHVAGFVERVTFPPLVYVAGSLPFIVYE